MIATDVGECGLLLQKTTNAQVGLVQGDNAGAGTGYATLRFANQNGMLSDGSYDTNVVIDKVVSRGGGRGVFCVSESGGAEIGTVDLSGNENNAIVSTILLLQSPDLCSLDFPECITLGPVAGD